jgi:molecular chaperone GrpE
MTDHNLNPNADDPQPSAGDPGADAGNETADVLAQLQQEIESIRTERNELENRLLRVSADYQNFVRRSEQNITTAREQQVMGMARSLLTVMDHFDNALSVDLEKTSAASLLQGVQIVRDELMKTLESFGIRRMDAARGDVFDPNRHEAMMRQQIQGLDAGHVAAQFQPGYTLNDKTLRPAKVSVTE